MGKNTLRVAILNAILLMGGTMALPETAHAQSQTQAYQIEAGDLEGALSKFGTESRIQLIYSPELLKGKRSAGLRGAYAPMDALRRLLENSGLVAEQVNEKTVVIKQAPPTAAPSQRPEPSRGDAHSVVTLPEMLVVGSRSQNVDIPRTEDDSQPYVVFSGEDIRNSEALTLEDFFRTRLPMNASNIANSQRGTTIGSTSSIDLRGLGPNQTLILLNGRRMPSVSRLGTVEQPDINGIPLSAIERIEVLPSTAAGIYGGGATGGVINIITRKGYEGYDVSLSYGQSSRGDASSYQVNFSGGFKVGDNISIYAGASRTWSDLLEARERDFAARGRQLQLVNNPGAFYSPTIVPPSGYTTNIRSQDGSDLVLDNGTPLNSPYTFIPINYAGWALDAGSALVGNAGSYNLDIPEDGQGGLRGLLPETEASSLFLNARAQITPNVELFMDLSWFKNDSSNVFSTPLTNTVLAADAPNNPFTTAVMVRYPGNGTERVGDTVSEVSRASSGLIVRLPSQWSALGEVTRSKSRYSITSTAFPVGDPDGPGPLPNVSVALANGSLDVMRDLYVFPIDWTPYALPSPNVFSEGDFTSTDAAIRLSGPVARLPGGDLMITGALMWRRDVADDYRFSQMSSAGTVSATGYPSRSQEVASLYAEARLPIIAVSNGIPLVRELEVQASVRRDDYETRAPDPSQFNLPSFDAPIPDPSYSSNQVTATKYTLGTRYQPIEGLTFRASLGTGFLPPSVSQITPVISPASDVLIDPLRGNVAAQVDYTRTSGGNPNLTYEESRSFSFGAILTPQSLDGFRLSIDYTKIRKSNEIANLSLQQVLNAESRFPGRIVRAQLTPEDIAAGFSGGAILGIDFSSVNVAATKLDVVDIQADYELDTESAGLFKFYAIGSWQPELERQTVPDSGFVDYVGFNGGILEWRGNVGINWYLGSWSAGWNAQYYDSYRVTVPGASAAQVELAARNQGTEWIPSQTYHDAYVGYRFNSAFNFFDGSELKLGVQNLFDKFPPILATTATTGGYSTYGDPRLRRFVLTFRKSF